jgi:hypothetical protein
MPAAASGISVSAAMSSSDSSAIVRTADQRESTYHPQTEIPSAEKLRSHLNLRALRQTLAYADQL